MAVQEMQLAPVFNDPHFEEYSYRSAQVNSYNIQTEMMKAAGKAIVGFPGYKPNKSKAMSAIVAEVPKYSIQTYQKMFERIDIFRSIILRMGDLILSVEKDIRPPSNLIQDNAAITQTLAENIAFCRKWKRFIGFDSWLRYKLICALWSGNAYTEVVRDPNSKWKITNLKLLPPDEMRPVRDEFGQVQGYVQYPFQGTYTWLNRDTAKKFVDNGGIWFEPFEIIHLKVDPLPGEAYGTSVAESLKDILAIIVGMREDIGMIVKNYAAPTILFRVGTELVPASPQTVQEMKTILESQMTTSTHLVTSTMVEGTILDTGKSVMSMEKYFDQMLALLFGSVGIPEIMVGQGNETTEATGKMQLEAVGHQVMVFHRLIKDVVELPLFSILCLGKNVNELTPSDMDKLPEIWFGPIETAEDKRLRYENMFRYGGITRQEWRIAYGMKPEPEGDLLPTTDAEFLMKQAAASKPEPMAGSGGGGGQRKPSDRDAEYGKKDAGRTNTPRPIVSNVEDDNSKESEDKSHD